MSQRPIQHYDRKLPSDIKQSNNCDKDAMNINKNDKEAVDNTEKNNQRKMEVQRKIEIKWWE